MKRGFVVGKFYPPHAGHHHLIRTAAAHADQLVVGVVDNPRYTIPAKLRATWLQETHPDVTVTVIPDINDDDNSEAWALHTKTFLGYTPSFVATSENYGTTWAHALNCEHILVDIDRTTYPVSGTKVRSDPFTYWQYLEPNVQAYFTPRVAVVGAESTGTTTLTRQLAEYYTTNWVPEYGRMYTEGKLRSGQLSANWTSHEFEHIASVQNQAEDEYARSSNELLICDTNAFATELWHELYMNTHSKAVAELAHNRHYLLHIVTSPDIPYEQDGTRDSEPLRQWMHERFIAELSKRNLPFIVVTGSKEKRLTQATAAIDAVLTDRKKVY